jgi:light-regulated signal transduction histidine kinase (bacteriophytochrome)
MVDGARRMKKLLEDLLSLSRVETHAIPFEPIDCNSLIENVRRDLSLRIQDSEAEIRVGSLPTLNADPSQLAQVFRNLIINGIKFRGEANPIIEVSAERLEEGWEFCVADNGIGIEKQFQDRIFIVFQRLNKRDDFEGNGIGLSIVRKIISRHGGHIRVESELGKGSKFIFTIPDLKESKS